MSFFIKKKKRHTGVLNSLWNKWQLWNQFCSFTLKTVVFVWVSLSTIYKCKFVILWWLCVSRNKKTNLGQKRERIKKKTIWYQAVVCRLLRQVEALMGHVVSFIYKSNRWKQRESERGVCELLWVTEGAKDVKGTGYKLIESEERLLSPLR